MLKQKHIKKSWKIARKAAPIVLTIAEATLPQSKTARHILKVGRLLF
jgi:hypothetical protein